MAFSDTLQMVCVEALYDYTQTEPADNTSHKNNFIQISSGTATHDPFLNYTMRSNDKISSGKFTISSGKVTI